MIITLQELKALNTVKCRLIALDLGDKTIGVALSDLTWTIASPFGLIKRTKLEKDMEKIQAIVVEHTVTAIVVGLPVNMNGSEGPRAKITQEFMKKMHDFLSIPLFAWDERLSTMAVTRTLLEADMSRKKRPKVIDKMAATFILQGVLDRLKTQC